MAFQPGARLGAYELLSLLGSGGMGEVYRARDVDLDRLVAIKVLPQRSASNVAGLIRFEREARLASSLNHPHIITIYNIGREGSTPYIVMELVEGRTLAAILVDGRLPLRTVTDIAVQIATGLARAHAAGIVHRDLKPQNLMVRNDGLVKILDFGLGTLTAIVQDGVSTMSPEASLTGAGVILGTVHYMSPEQAAAHPVDFRSDQFSLGSMLYEMIAGRRPFDRPTGVQTLSAIIEANPEPIAVAAPEIPELLRLVVERCLSKDPAGRFASTDDLARDLQTVHDHFTGSRTLSAVAAVPRRTALRTRAGLAVLAGTLGLVAVGALFVVAPVVREYSINRAVPPAAAGAQQLAVLPFVNVGNDPANQPFTDGLVEILSNQLTQIARPGSALDVVPSSDVRREGVTSARDAQRAFGVSRVITGSVLRTSASVRVTVNLVDTQTLRQLSARSIDLQLQDVAAMQDGVVREIAALIGASFGPDVRQTLTLGGTSVPSAYEAYVQARGHLQRYEKLENVDAAVVALQRAVTQDPRFALAHAGLGEAYWRKYNLTKDTSWASAARTSCATALGLADGLAAVYVTLGLIDSGTGRYENAVDELKHAVSLDPLNSDAYRELANAYQALRKTSEAEATYKTAIQVRPGYWANHSALGSFYFRQARYAEAEAQFRRIVDRTPDNIVGYNSLGGVYYVTKRYDQAEKMFRKSLDVRLNYVAYSNLGTLYFSQARYGEAARMFERAVTFSDRDSQVWVNLASALHWAPGERPKARAAYERALALAEQESRVNSRDAALLLRIADCHAMLGHAVNARQLVEEALKIAPEDVNLMVKAGQIYEQIGDRDRALQWMNKALVRGYSRDILDRSPSLASLRTDPRFSVPSETRTERK